MRETTKWLGPQTLLQKSEIASYKMHGLSSNKYSNNPIQFKTRCNNIVMQQLKWFGNQLCTLLFIFLFEKSYIEKVMLPES